MKDADRNLILATDSYKITHGVLYPPKTETIYSYFESRGGKYPETVFYGLQGILKANLAGRRVWATDIDEAETLLNAHFGKPLVNRAAWEHIMRDHGGRLPLSIRAVPEGTVVPIHNVLMTVENTCPQCYWLTNYVETLLVQTWYPTTVATISREAKKIILRYLERTGDPALVDLSIYFKLHDFGFRGVSSPESAGIGGCAHLVNFKGTDTLAALVYARDYYHEACAGFSIPATEHSIMTINGPEGELDMIRRVLAMNPTGLVACVIDSYDPMDAVSNKIGTVLHDEIMARDGTLVVRPDSGYPPKVVLEVVDRLYAKFGGTTNAKGYKVLDSHVRVIQGDGVNPDSIEECLHQLQFAGYSADNVAFGMGGALLQKLDRDTCQFAFKASSRTIDGVEAAVYKKPKLDEAKNSKSGRLELHRDAQGQWMTAQRGVFAPEGDQLVEVFRDGAVVNSWTLAQIRERAALMPVPISLTT